MYNSNFLAPIIMWYYDLRFDTSFKFIMNRSLFLKVAKFINTTLIIIKINVSLLAHSWVEYIMVKQHYHLHTSFVYRWVWEDEKGLHVGNLQTYLAWYEINVRLIGPIKTTLRYKMVKQEG